jgi:nucleotide-binding universal stress UspA family protein
MRLLLAVDLNEHADDLVDAGRLWAERVGATLDLVYVDEHSYNAYLVQDPAVRTVLDREWEKVREQLRQRVSALQAGLPGPVRGGAEVRMGRAAEEIVEAGKGHDAILIATHGRRGLSHALLGSVAERVVRLSTVPVLVLRWPA